MTPLCAIGAAVCEIIGLTPLSFEGASEAIWASQPVFDSDPFFQPTAMGEETITLSLATRPHTHGGLDQWAILKQQQRARKPVLFIRLVGSIEAFAAGEVMGMVAIRNLSKREEKLAPDGIGWRHEFEVELVKVGENAGLTG